MEGRALLIHVEARPQAAADLEHALVRAAGMLAGNEHLRFALTLRTGVRQYLLLAAFDDRQARDGLLGGALLTELAANSREWLAQPAGLQQADVIASRLPKLRPAPTRALLLPHTEPERVLAGLPEAGAELGAVALRCETPGDRTRCEPRLLLLIDERYLASVLSARLP